MDINKDIDMILPYPFGKWWFRAPHKLRPSLEWTTEEERFGRDLIESIFPENRKFIITINSATGTQEYYPYNKDWGFTNFNSLISKIFDSIPEAKIILVDKDNPAKYQNDARIFDSRGHYSVPESISIIANSDLFICLDSGPANLVYFLKGISLNIIALVGEPQSFFKFKNPPASNKVEKIEIQGNNNLIENIQVETVFETVHNFYKQHLK